MAEALLELVGWFWRAATPQQRAPGRLIVDGTGRILLTLSGSLRDDFHLYFGTSSRNDGLTFHEQHLIYGYCGQPVTLYQCQRIYGSLQGTESYEAISVLTGGHFPEEPRFNLVKMHFANLSNWMKGKPNLATFSEFEFRGTETRMALVQHNDDLAIEFILDDQNSLDEIIDLCSHIQMLGEIGLNDSAPMTCLTVSKELGKTWYELFTSEIQADKSMDFEEYFQAFLNNTIFHFSDIGGLDGMARWIETSEKFRPVITLLKDARRNPMEHLDSNAIKNIIAAEIFAKIQSKTTKITNFRRTLRSLAEYAGEPFIGSLQADKWAQKVVILRKDLIHPVSARIVSPEESYWLSETIYYLLVLCLLKECGIPEGALTAIQKHGMLEWVGKEFRRYL